MSDEWVRIETEQDPDWFELQKTVNGKRAAIWLDPYGMKVSVTDYHNGGLRRKVKRLKANDDITLMQAEAEDFAHEE